MRGQAPIGGAERACFIAKARIKLVVRLVAFVPKMKACIESNCKSVLLVVSPTALAVGGDRRVPLDRVFPEKLPNITVACAAGTADIDTTAAIRVFCNNLAIGMGFLSGIK